MPAFGFASSVMSVDELGIWQPLPGLTAREFSPEGAPGGALESVGVEMQAGDVSLWQVALPAGRAASAAVLSLAAARLAVAEAALPYASQRLAAFSTAGGPSLGLPPGAEGPEVALAGWVAEGRSGMAPPEERGTLDQAGAFFEKVKDTLRNYAAIDTRVGDGRAGLTLVSWTGDFRTAWAAGLTPDDAQRHVQAVGLALRTRDAWLRLGLTVARGAVEITALFSVNPALAVPAVYRFVRQVIDQVQALGGLPSLA